MFSLYSRPAVITGLGPGIGRTITDVLAPGQPEHDAKASC